MKIKRVFISDSLECKYVSGREKDFDMDKINKMFLQALKASLLKKKVKWDYQITQEEWLRLFHQAEIHHILPMIYDTVYSCPSAKKMDASFFIPFKKKTIQYVMAQTIKTSEFLQLYQYLRKSGISPVMVKGIICRELYPNPDYRVSGDEDMLIRPEDFDFCHDKLLEYGMTVADPGMDVQEAYEVPYGKPGSPIYIELHKYLFPPDSEAYGEFNQFFEDIHERTIEITVQGVPVSAMEHTFHFFYLVCHAFKHFLHSGFGIRQVCDIVLYANEYGSQIDWKKVLEECKAIHAELFTAALLRIGEKYLVFDAEKACCPAEWSNMEVDEMMLLNDLLDAGVYGGSNMNRKHSSNITLNAVTAQKSGKHGSASVLKTVFPTVKSMSGRYPYLKKHPWMLPAAWADRILKYKKETSRVAGHDAASPVQIGNDRIELMRQYGIIK